MSYQIRSGTNDLAQLDLRQVEQQTRRSTRVRRLLRQVCPQYDTVDDAFTSARSDNAARERFVTQLAARGGPVAQEIIVALYIPQLLSATAAKNVHGVDQDDVIAYALTRLGTHVIKLFNDPPRYSLSWYLGRSLHRDIFRFIKDERKRAQSDAAVLRLDDYDIGHKDPCELLNLYEDTSSDSLGTALHELTDWIISQAPVSREDAALLVWSTVAGIPLKHDCTPSEGVRRYRVRAKVRDALQPAVAVLQ